jgi:hypothetical protein
MKGLLPEDRLLRFYDGIGTDHRGRRLEDIWEWDHGRLESVHDYIQWVFPTGQRSSVNPSAPLVTDDVRGAFANSGELRGRLRRSLDVMLGFYGLRMDLQDDGPCVVRGANFDQRRRNWLTYGNHNHLRITRILTSLRLLGLQGESRAFLRCLIDIYESGGSRGISRDAYEFWRAAGE